MRKLLQLGFFFLLATKVYAQTLPDYLEKQVRSGSLTRQEALIMLKGSGTNRPANVAPVVSPTSFSQPSPQSSSKAIQVDTSRAPLQGNLGGNLKIVQFCDFQCPYCAASRNDLARVFQKYGNQAQVSYLNLPLSFHREAQRSAKAAWAAGRQNKFFEYQDLLFQNQKRLTPTIYPLLATQLGLDIERFDEERLSAEAQTQLDLDLAEAKRLGFRGTPTYVINGLITKTDVSLDSIQKILTEPNSYTPPNGPGCK